MKPSAFASLAAAMTSSSVASSFPKRMFSVTVPVKRCVSCRYDAEGPTQVGFFDLIDVDAVIADLAVLDVVKAVDQVCDCRLTGPGGADKCDFLSRLRVQLYVVEYDLVIRM